MNNELPTDELKKYGIMDANQTFSKKLTDEDIEKFLNGYTLVADNDKDRITFQLVDNNNRLDVNIFQRDQNIEEVIAFSKHEIQYSDFQYAEFDGNDLGDEREQQASDFFFEKKAILYDENLNKVVEYDLVKNSEEFTEKVLERNHPAEINRYHNELMKLKSLLYDKMDKFPEIAKEITQDINIVSKAASAINAVMQTKKTTEIQQQTKVDLKVNDPDMYQDAYREREIEEEREEKRGFRR